MEDCIALNFGVQKRSWKSLSFISSKNQPTASQVQNLDFYQVGGRPQFRIAHPSHAPNF